MNTITCCTALLFLASGWAIADSEEPPNTAPEGFVDELRVLTNGSGHWITDNADYKNEQEPFDAYGTEWTLSFDGTTMTGRLFGIQDGKEVGTFWEFRHYWHPERREAVIEQFGWGGTIGIGTMWIEDGVSKSDQRFYSVDGAQSRTGHASHFPDADTRVTESFDIEPDQWTPKRKYIWRRTPAGGV